MLRRIAFAACAAVLALSVPAPIAAADLHDVIAADPATLDPAAYRTVDAQAYEGFGTVTVYPPAVATINRWIDWGDGVGFEIWQLGQASYASLGTPHTYDKPGTFTPVVRQQVAWSGAPGFVPEFAEFSLPTVTVLDDTVKPALTLGKVATKLRSGTVKLAGTTRDAESGVAVVFVEVYQQRRDGGWYTWRWGAGWKAARDKTTAAEHAYRARSYPRRRVGEWKLPVTGLRPGTVYIKARAMDYARNYSATVKRVVTVR